MDLPLSPKSKKLAELEALFAAARAESDAGKCRAVHKAMALQQRKDAALDACDFDAADELDTALASALTALGGDSTV